MSKKRISTIKELSKDSQKLFDVLSNEHDLSAILIAANFIDTCLASLLEKKLKKSLVTNRILSFSGILGSMSSRADLCYALELIPKEIYQDLLILMQIRNIVAHYHLQLDFDKDEVKELCNKLSYVDGMKDGNTDDSLISREYLTLARDKFKLTVVMISQRLMLIGLGLNHEQNV